MIEYLEFDVSEGESLDIKSSVKHLTEDDVITVEHVGQSSQGGDKPVGQVRLKIVRNGEP